MPDGWPAKLANLSSTEQRAVATGCLMVGLAEANTVESTALHSAEERAVTTALSADAAKTALSTVATMVLSSLEQRAVTTACSIETTAAKTP